MPSVMAVTFPDPNPDNPPSILTRMIRSDERGGKLVFHVLVYLAALKTSIAPSLSHGSSPQSQQDATPAHDRISRVNIPELAQFAWKKYRNALKNSWNSELYILSVHILWDHTTAVEETHGLNMRGLAVSAWRDHVVDLQKQPGFARLFAYPDFETLPGGLN